MGKKNEKGQFARNENKWSFFEDIAYCYLGNDLLFFTDLSVYEVIKNHSFCRIANGYSAVNVHGKEIPVHRLISKPGSNEVVDHIDGNKKDNRLCNLRNTNKSVNAFNCKKRTTNKSGRTGVHFRQDTKRWSAEIKVDGKKIMLGCYEHFEDAAKARERAEIEFYGGTKRDE